MSGRVTGYILDTSVLSPMLDAGGSRHRVVVNAVEGLPADATQFISRISVAELEFGVRLAEVVTGASSPDLQQKLARAHDYAVLEVTRHTAAAYAALRANLAARYLAKKLRNDRPRWVEDWIDRATGKRLQVDENDLWICAQAKERDLVVITADRHMDRIENADPEVRLHVVAG